MHNALFASILILLIQLQPPPPTPSKITKEEQNHSSGKTEKANPEKQSPPPTPPNNPIGVAKAACNKTAERKEISSTDWWLTGFTGALALVAIFQLIAMLKQAEYMRKGLRISIRAARGTRVAANAAKQSADTAERSAAFAQNALRSCERADILLDEAQLIGPAGNRIYPMPEARLELTFRNFGRTRAKDVSFKVRMIIREAEIAKSPIPELPLIVMGSGQEKIILTDALKEFLPAKDIDELGQRKISMRFVSWLVYRDVFGVVHTSRNVGELDPRTFNFRIEEATEG